MSTQPATIVQRLWNYCNVLRDDGVSYGDCVERLTPAAGHATIAASKTPQIAK
jgi:hypothetical protein